MNIIITQHDAEELIVNQLRGMGAQVESNRNHNYTIVTNKPFALIALETAGFIEIIRNDIVLQTGQISSWNEIRAIISKIHIKDNDNIELWFGDDKITVGKKDLLKYGYWKKLMLHKFNSVLHAREAELEPFIVDVLSMASIKEITDDN